MPDNDPNAGYSKLEFYRKKVAAIMKQICKLKDAPFMKQLTSLHESEIELRMENLEKLYMDFDKYPSFAEESDISEIENVVREDCSAVYFLAKSALRKELKKRQLAEHHQSTFNETQPTLVLQQQQKIRLPALNIPKLAGITQNGLIFIQCFRRLLIVTLT